MKNIHFSLVLAAMLAFTACSGDNGDPQNGVSSSSSGVNSSSGSISACFISANLSPAMNFSLCWESETMVQEKCDGIANDYKNMGASEGEIIDSCPKEEITDSCSPENGGGTVYRYNKGTMPIPMPCASLLSRL